MDSSPPFNLFSRHVFTILIQGTRGGWTCLSLEFAPRCQTSLPPTFCSSFWLWQHHTHSCFLFICSGDFQITNWSIHDPHAHWQYSSQFCLDHLCRCFGKKSNPSSWCCVNDHFGRRLRISRELLGFADCCRCWSNKSKVSRVERCWRNTH